MHEKIESVKKIFETAIFTRQAMLDILGSLTAEQFSRIPEGHNNSVFWNIAHVMVTQQLLTYGLSGQPLIVDDTFVKRYSKGSIASPEVPQTDVDYVKNDLLALCKRAEQDFEKGLFQSYRPYMTSTGIELKTIQDGIEFSAYHDGIHLGVVLSLKKLV